MIPISSLLSSGFRHLTLKTALRCGCPKEDKFRLDSPQQDAISYTMGCNPFSIWPYWGNKNSTRITQNLFKRELQLTHCARNIKHREGSVFHKHCCFTQSPKISLKIKMLLKWKLFLPIFKPVFKGIFNVYSMFPVQHNHTTVSISSYKLLAPEPKQIILKKWYISTSDLKLQHHCVSTTLRLNVKVSFELTLCYRFCWLPKSSKQVEIKIE